HAHDGRGDARIAQRELQRRSRERYAVLLADVRDGLGSADELGWRLGVRVARVCPGTLGQQTAAIWRCVQHSQSTPLRHLDQRRRSRSALVDSTAPSGSPPISRMTRPIRRSLSPSPYEAAVSRKLNGLANAVLTVSSARSSGTE